jgi:hypothetical protein
MREFNWTCEFCGITQTVGDAKFFSVTGRMDVGENKHGSFGYQLSAIGCSNPACKEVYVRIFLGTVEYNRHSGQLDFKEVVSNHYIRPESNAKPQPDYIPIAIRQDYEEACKIRHLSPKASATLSRRCIQGMIRDFCNIKAATLNREIEELRRQTLEGSAPPGVSAESIDALDHIRQVGNIGAHMEKDINVIIEVDPDEAQVLVDIVELLFQEWYIARKARQDRLAKVKSIAERKADVRAALPVSSDCAKD